MKYAADFGKTADDYRTHRQGFPQEFFDRLEHKKIIFKNQKVLDIGTGTGTIARGLALKGCKVIGLDPSASMIESAKHLDANAGISIDYQIGSAENTHQALHSFDLITAGQCWHWFDADLAMAEIKRILKPQGLLVIAHYDWIPATNNVAGMTEALILKYNPGWPFSNGNGFYPKWVRQLVAAEFKDVETFSFDVNAQYSHEAWRGRIRASAGIAASDLSAEAIQQFDTEHKAALLKNFPEDPLSILHRCFVITAHL